MDGNASLLSPPLSPTVWHHLLVPSALHHNCLMNDRQPTRCRLKHISFLSSVNPFLSPFLPKTVRHTVGCRCAQPPLSSLGLSSAIRPAVVYWLGFVVQQDNRVVWLEWADEWCSRSRTKSPPLCFIDVLMRLNWLPSEFVLYTVVGRQMPVDTWCWKGLLLFVIAAVPLTFTVLLW